jgi:hypothetical protein
MRDSRYIDIPGSRTHELPPLLVHSATEHAPAEDMESVLGEAEDMLGASDASPDILDQRRFDLALQLKEQYKGLLSHWLWGDSILEWIRQCEITFECEDTLRQLLHPDIWPRAGRASFITLLMEKNIHPNGITLDKAVGLRLIFREPSPVRCLSGEFLFLLSPVVADTAYSSWSGLAPGANALLPPERFHFDVVNC